MMGDIAPRSNGGFKAVIENSNTSNPTAQATGINAVVAGAGAIASGAGAVVIGAGAKAYGAYQYDGSSSVVIGKNANTNGSGVVIGNSASSTGASNETIVIGKNATASGNNSITIGYNASNTASTNVCIGYQANTNTSNNTIALGGSANTVSGSGTISLGAGGSAKANAILLTSSTWGNAVGEYDGHICFTTGRWSSGGGAGLGGYLVSTSFVNLIMQTTNATPTELSIAADGSDTPSTKIVLLADSTYSFNCDLVARDTATDTSSSVWNICFAIRRGAAAANTALIGTPTYTIIGQDAATTAWAVSVTADTTNGRPAITVTGAAATTIRWLATCKVTRISG